MIIFLIVATAVAVAALGVFGFFYLQLQRQRREQRGSRIEGKASWGICAKCQQQRVIVEKDAALCAYCWSSMRTKPLA